MPEDAIVSDEAATCGLGIYPATENAPPHDWLMLTGGAIGQGLPLSLGAAIACPDRKVIALQAEIIEQARKVYSESVIERWLNPRNVGRIENPQGFGRLTGICGDINSQISLGFFSKDLILDLIGALKESLL